MADTSWIGDEPLEMVSAFASNGTKEVPFDFIGRNEDLEVVILSTSDRMCSHFPDYSFPMYEGDFKYISFRLSFSDFPVGSLQVDQTVSTSDSSQFLCFYAGI
jgi:hypothetical protein